MPSKSSGRIAKVRKNKYSTPHQKNHRWQSFSDKIAQFNSLQPLRRVRRHDLDEEDLSAATSYFRTGIQKWNELNIGRCFVSFKQKVLPISETLPQILHFEARIMDLLEEHIAEQDKDGLEPLLDLLTAFAHDLGARFEKYYERSLALIIAVAGRPQPAEVLEWTFGALAFLFKYLAKLLVPDVRPTYQVMAVLLGKTRQPGHVARFAAEALSFLVRKAAAPSYRETALAGLVAHVREDLAAMAAAGDKQFTLYNDGIMTMFAEAVKHTDGTVHSTGAAVLTTLMDAIPDEEKAAPGASQVWTDVVCGVLTSTIHHVRAEHFDEFAEAIYDAVERQGVAPKVPPPAWTAIPYIRVLGTLAGVRKGSRISNWNRLIGLLADLLAKMVPCPAATDDELSRDDSDGLWSRVLVSVAVTWHHAPVDALLLRLASLTRSLTREPLMRWFIPFCSLFCELDPRRFGSLLRGDFQKFIAAHWSHGTHSDGASNEEMLCTLLPQMMERRAFPPPTEKDALRLPQSWQDQIVSKFEHLEISPFPERGPYNKDPQVWRDRCLPKYAALLQVLELTAVHPSTNARIAELLLKKLKLALRPSSTLDSDEVRFIVGPGFHAYLGMSKAAGVIDPTLSRLLRAALPRFARSVGFLRSYLTYVSSVSGSESPDAQATSEENVTETDPAIASLIENLGSPSHDIRLTSLQLLQYMDKSATVLDVMLQIEETPLQLQNTRSIGMLMRKLGQDYMHVDSSSWLSNAVPSFLFGLLTVKLSPVWDDAIETLKHVAQSKAGEEAIAKIAFRWMEVPSPRWKGPIGDASATQKPVLSDFDCTAYMALTEAGKKARDDAVGAATRMLETFDQEQQLVENLAEFARNRALKVFNALPAIAEKRSRQLVPHLLCWAGESEDAVDDGTDEDVGDDEDKNWSLADRKSIIGVFSQFVNPKVLYQHDKVYDALLRLLEHGDIEVQKLALKGILAWKQEGVKTYQENLEFLLDEARFKNEIAVFLQDDELIKPAHKPQLMPVLLRLLYGRTISKKGVASGRQGQLATRLAVIRNLSLQDMGDFLDIVMGKLRGVQVLGQSAVQSKPSFNVPIITPRQQVGFVNMVSSLITEMGSSISQYMEKVLSPVLYCLIYACRNLRDASVEGEESDKASSASLLRVNRVTSIKCLISLFQNAQDFQWEPYHDLIIEEVVAPRMENFAGEMTQGVSGLMQLFSTWSVLPKSALFLAPRDTSLPVGVLPSVIDCITAEKTKDDVKIHSLEILRNLVKLAVAPASESEFNELIKVELLDANVKKILAGITKVLEEQTVSHALLEACVETILAFAVVVQDIENIQSVIRISSYLLNQPPRRVSPKTKGRILLIVESFVSMEHAGQDAQLLQQVYDTLSSLFGYFKDRENRQSLARALLALSKQDPEVAVVASLCRDLNSYKEGRLDEPDYDQRLGSFTTIAAAREVAWTPKQWLPVLHNLIYFIRDDQEFGVLSTNSADGLRRFVQDVADSQPADVKAVFEEMLRSVLMPAVYTCARDPSETVRRQTLRVLGFLLSTMPDWTPVADLKGLLVEHNEESTDPAFFFNLLSPAVARQLEALKTLEAANLSQEMSSQNLSQFFIPLLEHFIFGREDGADDHGLGAQATATIGTLAMSLHWNHYRTTLQRYISYVGSKPELQKQTIRLAGRFADSLSASLESKEEDDMEVDGEGASAQKQRLATSISKTQLPVDISEYFLPPLTKYLHEKDESEVSYRVPVGVIIVKLLRLLPEQQMTQKLAGVLTDICHILRSKNEESRDLTRDTLVQIAVVLGPGYFGFLLKELRSALTRGYQLHVLSYTMHSILVASVPSFGPGDLDHCLPSIVTVIMDDIFGVVGQEKDAEGYTTQTKEIKGSKSQDSMELVAKTATVTHLIHLVKPLQALLMEKVDLKMVRKIDALMSRITVGLMQNPAAESRDTLVFCYEVIQEVYNSQKPQQEQKMDPRVRKYLIQKGAKKSDRGKGAKHTYKLMRFAFDILRAMLKKHDSLRTPENIAGFLPIMGDAIVAGEDEIKISTFRLLAAIVKVPMGEDGANLFKVTVREATKSISMSTSTTTDLAQAALKLLSVLLRDRRDVIVKDAAVDMLLGKLKDDFTEPLYRHVTFNFLRSVLDRRIETAAVYDTLDHVGTVMITNDDKDTRDLARGAFFQFIREYPQKKARWAKQLDFIVANLKYDREGGRLSVLEILHLLLMKASDEFVQQVASTCFLPLFFVLANDESEKCQLAAAELIKEIFQKADKERMQQFLTLLRSWLDKKDNLPVLRLGLAVFGYYFEANEEAARNKKDYKLVLSTIGELLAQDVTELDADLVNTIISIVQLFTVQYPERILTPENEQLWINVALCLQHEDANVRLVTIRLIALYLGDFAKQSGGTPPGQALKGSHGLTLPVEKLQDYVRLSLNVLGGAQVDEALAKEVTQVIIFLGPRLADVPEKKVVEKDVDEEEKQAEGEEEEDEEEEAADQDDEEVAQRPRDIGYLFWRLSHILRKEIRPRAPAIVPKVHAMEALETIARRIPAERLRPSLRKVLEPLHHLTDPSIPVPFSADDEFRTALEGVKARAHIMMDALQKKFGTAEYTRLLLAVREQVRRRRQQRSSKRKIEAIAQPEKYGRDKRKKLDRNKERRKVRSKEQKTMRQTYKTW
ncbi:Armadillo-type fold protein [Cordyceps fumosorosea ARSEF 2679]|uniref:Armadillo-type fold protein n=1 Tax=Cordyceps fumosorosea (strain ARSEF 2679) TaxID=1081104 RepID=A0A162JNF3_CORFA|nr:Armadillo-type fold protein [Cordyceps fumosorosea ARSEF 2679]OAA71452.1 Armadillo-type fold protein [Cordyceps fumosorosea ARSEF 2679]